MLAKKLFAVFEQDKSQLAECRLFVGSTEQPYTAHYPCKGREGV